MKIVFLSFIFLILSDLSKEVLITLTSNKEFCIYRDLYKSDVLKFSYSVSGDKESENSVSIIAHNNNYEVLYNNHNQDKTAFKNSDTLELKSESKTTYSICMITPVKFVSVSFEIYTEEEAGNIINLAGEKHLDKINANLTSLAVKFEEIEKNMKFFMDRKGTHSKGKY